MIIPEMCLKPSFSHCKWVLQVIMSLTDCPFKLCFWQFKVFYFNFLFFSSSSII